MTDEQTEELLKLIHMLAERLVVVENQILKIAKILTKVIVVKDNKDGS